MSVLKKMAQNSLAIILSSVIENVFNFIISICIIRYFGQNGYGKLAFLSTFFLLLTLTYDLWVRPILVREMAQDEARAPVIAGNGFVINGLMAFCAVAMFWVMVFCVKPTSEIVMLASFASVNLLISSVTTTLEAIYLVKMRMGFLTLFGFLSKALALASVFFIILLKGTLYLYYLFSIGVSLVLLFYLMRRTDTVLKAAFRFDRQLWRTVFKEAWPLGLSAFFIFVYYRLSNILLFNMKGPAAVGVYSVSLRLSESLNVIPAALTCTVLPLLSRYHNTSRENFKRLYEFTFKYPVLFIIPAAFFVSIFSEQIVTLFFGQKFLASAPCLVILMWSEVFTFLGIVNNAILIASNKQKIDPVFTGVSAAVSVSLNILLLPSYGLIGAAIASLASCAAGPVLGYFLPQTRNYSLAMARFSVRPLAASLVMFSILYYVRPPFVLSLIIAPAAYLAVLWAIQGVKASDFDFFRENLKEGRSSEWLCQDAIPPAA